MPSLQVSVVDCDIKIFTYLDEHNSGILVFDIGKNTDKQDTRSGR